MKLNEVERLFVGQAKWLGGVFLLAPSDAIDFVRTCREREARIFGIEGFFVYSGDSIRPSQDHTVDYDEEDPATHKKAEEFLMDNLESGMMFEVIIDDEGLSESEGS